MSVIQRMFSGLFTRRFLVWWLCGIMTFLTFDLLWCAETTYAAFTYRSLWPFLLFASTLFAMPMVFCRKIWLQASLFILLDMLLVANLMYCRTYFNAIPLDCYTMAGNLKDFTGSVFDSVRWYDLTFPLLTALSVALTASPKVNASRPKTGYYAGLLAVTGVLSVSMLVGRGGFMERMDAMASSCDQQNAIAPVYTVFTYLIYDYLSSDQELTPGQRTNVDEWLEEHERLNHAGDKAGIISPPKYQKVKDVVVILCESLESWPIGAVVEGRSITPFLNTLVGDTTVLFVPRLLTQVATGRSIDAQLLMLAGQTPLRKGVFSMKYADNCYRTLPLAMKESGRRTELLSSDLPTTWNQGVLARSFGFDTLISKEDWGPASDDDINALDGYLYDHAFFNKIIERMESGDISDAPGGTFTLVVTHSGHNPFRIDDSHKPLRLNGEYPEILKNYIETTAYVDASLEKFVSYLLSRAGHEDTMIVITGDHEGLASYRNGICGDDRYDFVSRERMTPLIVVNGPVGGRVEGTYGQVDVYTTLLDLTGNSGYEWRGMGLSILSDKHPKVAVDASNSLSGDTVGVSREIIGHITEMYGVGDLMLRHDMLERPL